MSQPVAKQNVNYRKAEPRSKKRCKNCIERKLRDIHGLGDSGVIGKGHRCAPVGFQNSRKYSIQEGCVCDRFTDHASESEMEISAVTREKAEMIGDLNIIEITPWRLNPRSTINEKSLADLAERGFVPVLESDDVT